ncbi:MAG: formate/nitrite transporter family protein [Rhodospirillales bacterium]|jgi:formate/nitrite transporter|nr:formate/nitrite transporter family protein [Rhodospirillales bacterium]MBT4040651.1 formate/nitrite transporter family protein [Rhodospirillales bacterium]MBT4626193.1 formate/nitrite transporter family protein [Rhodospirillales bacterium]MBT5353221.1 formate/nitrite transporter family protein [Rhodospirillales bacterium]MBT5522438.1 formate/nitrite transporter family protein [Rhodospirillales bacterium]
MPNDQSAHDIDAYAPHEIAQRAETVGVAKAHLSFIPMVMLAILAGAFIAFGAAFYTLVMTDSGLGFGPARLLGGLAFSTGLILVIVGGAELFTGNNLIVMAWADGKVSHRQLLRNWVVAYAGNFVGSLGVAAMVGLSGVLMLHDGGVAKTAIAIAEGKLALSASEAFVRGVLCNTLVCLAVWLCFSARTVVGKVMAIVFPVSAFVALGFEHSIANMYLIPIGYFAGSDSITVSGFLGNLIPVTAGNIVGGSGFVALTYWAIYLRKN